MPSRWPSIVLQVIEALVVLTLCIRAFSHHCVLSYLMLLYLVYIWQVHQLSVHFAWASCSILSLHSACVPAGSQPPLSIWPWRHMKTLYSRNQSIVPVYWRYNVTTHSLLFVSPQTLNRSWHAMTMLHLTVMEEMSLVWALPGNAVLEMAIGFRIQTLGGVSNALVSNLCDKCHAKNRAVRTSL